MHDVMKRHEVKLLNQAGVSHAKIASTTDVPLRSVERIVAEKEEPPPTHASTSLAKARGVGRPSTVEKFRAVVEEILKEEPDLPTVEILHRVRGRGYDGGKSQLYGVVARLRPAAPGAPVVRFEGLPGEFSQNDFGQVDVEFQDGTRTRVHFFAARLKYSRWVFVRIVPDEAVESLVRSLLLSFESFGGVPLLAVFDNPKTVVIERRGTKIQWNSTFGQAALDYRFAPELCAPARGNQKGAVENLVGWVKKSFFKVRRFHDPEDLRQQLDAWLVESNTARASRATHEIPSVRLEQERARLRPLSVPAADYALRFPVTVGPTAVVEFKGVRYAMPPATIGFPATLHLYENKVRITARRVEVVHDRHPVNGKTSFRPELRAAHLAQIAGERGRLYFKRQQVLDLGADAEAMLTELVHRHPRTWKSEVEILFALLQEFGEARLKQALKRAVDRRLYAARSVETFVRRAV
jgi:transposase